METCVLLILGLASHPVLCTDAQPPSWGNPASVEEHDVSQCFVYIKNVCGGAILDNFLSCLLLKTQGEGKGGMIWENGIETCIIYPWAGKIPWRRKWLPTPVSLPGKSVDRGAWRATVLGSQRVGHG